MDLEAIGKVKNRFDEPEDIKEMRESESQIIVDENYIEGLDGLDKGDFLKVVFYFHESNDYELKGKRREGKVRGVFASRSPHRPSQIGVTTVQLMEKDENVLKVYGLDAMNGTPILDIKPYSSWLDEPTGLKNLDNPRQYINTLVEKEKYDSILAKAGELHGHYCPNLSLGVIGGSYAMKKLKQTSIGMEDVIAIIETNNCFSDGIQYSTGCTFGNNSLIYRDYGKTAFTLIERKNQESIRLYFKQNDFLEKEYPETQELFQKVIVEKNGDKKDSKKLTKKWKQIAYDFTKKQPTNLFKIEKNPQIDKIPKKAPIYEDKYCDKCDEKVMATRIIKKEQTQYCIPCADETYIQLDGRGMIQK
ncbi:MAG: Formylmethanofuran dehydrogenase subunit E [Candidatus Methanohalarchaeum thermophilum]|uniref:Formylmethanofuran dehydrogenase subunit E n=1 Tax=Methanohalarchaeum thermophilum TaxID=1903181 RepID=A0A1Q6DT22_METT1|nr:MAG: Formylmethanofuran dehydrogenase subunit E [Candidatus Methanohalarchaeum thermophilum]